MRPPRRSTPTTLFTLLFLVPLSLSVLTSCQSGGDAAADSGDAGGGETASDPAPVRGDIPEIVQQMVDAHGGYDTWANAPSVSYRDSLLFAGAPAAISSRPMIEGGKRRIAMEFPGTQMRMAWDGEKAWSVNWAMPVPPRFFSSLTFYFANLPWLALDPGVTLTDEGSGTLPGGETEYRKVRMTFGDGVGDSPGDHYILFIDPDNHQLRGTVYSVTYRGIGPADPTTAPENHLVFDEWTSADGLIVPAKFTIYATDGSVFATVQFDEWSFTKPFDPSKLSMPEGAVVDGSLDAASI